MLKTGLLGFRHWGLGIWHSLGIGYWSLVISRPTDLWRMRPCQWVVQFFSSRQRSRALLIRRWSSSASGGSLACNRV